MPQFLTIRLWVSSEEKKKSKADVQLGFYTQPESLLGDADLSLNLWQKYQYFLEESL